MPEEPIPEGMRARPEQYEETEHPHNPPQSTGSAPAFVVGVWYYLAPLALVILLIAFALIYWEDRNSIKEPSEVEPTTGTVDQPTPGGHNPDRRPNTTEDELDFRGDR